MTSCDICPDLCLDKSKGGIVLYKGAYCSCYKLNGQLKGVMHRDYLLKLHKPDKNNRNRLDSIEFVGITTAEFNKYNDAYKKDAAKILGAPPKVSR